MGSFLVALLNQDLDKSLYIAISDFHHGFGAFVPLTYLSFDFWGVGCFNREVLATRTGRVSEHYFGLTISLNFFSALPHKRASYA